MRKILFFILLSLILGSLNCSYKDCTTKSGNTANESRLLPVYNSIEINDIFDVQLSNGSNSSVKIQAGENIIPYIKTEVKDSVLYISNDISCRFVRGFEHFPQITIDVSETLQSVTINKASDISTLDTLQVNHILFKFLAPVSSANLHFDTRFLAFELWGKASGDFKISGKTEYLTILNDGLAEIDAKNIIAKFLKIESYSPSNSYIRATHSISSVIFAEGNVYHTGSAEVLLNEELSSGELLFVPNF